jgi:hypothetical protein
MIIADETHNNPVLVADLSDLETPTLVSSFQSTLLGSTNSIAHNPYIVGNDFVVLSYYDDGLQIYKIDSSDNPFLAGYYDTDTLGTSYSGDGAWGAYPYLPSGNLIASDIENGLYVMTPKFPLSDCLSQILVEGIYDNHWDFVSQDQFSTDATYREGTDLIIRAPGIIELLPGFNIGAGSVLTANIEDLCAVANKTGKYRGEK